MRPAPKWVVATLWASGAIVLLCEMTKPPADPARAMEADQVTDAYLDCITTIESRALFGYRTDTFPNYTSVVSGGRVTIEGRDVHLQNGFGAYSNAPYLCVWDVNSRSIITAVSRTPG